MSLREELIGLISKGVLESEKEELFREPLVGFSSANDPLFIQLKEIVGPEHLYPQDILPEAKTVVSFFIPFSEKVVSSNRKSDSVSQEWAESYLEANILINEISQKIIKYLEGQGILAATVKATHTFDEKTLKSGWSHRSAAYIAGLGRFGVNRMLITPVGCAGRYGSVVISQEVTPDTRPEEELCTYYKNGTCLVCISNCPTKALGVNELDKHKCYAHLLEITKEFTPMGFCDVCGKCVMGPCAIINKRYVIHDKA